MAVKNATKRVEITLENLLFSSRWLLAPFYFGLAISLIVLLPLNCTSSHAGKPALAVDQYPFCHSKRPLRSPLIAPDAANPENVDEAVAVAPLVTRATLTGA